MKRYEGLFILNTTSKEDGVKEIIDKIAAEITAGGGTVETVQKMDKRNFTRVADKKHSAGFFVNIIFESAPGALRTLQHRLTMSDDVFRVLLTVAPTPKATA